jgi:hypothetical protein
MLNAGETNPIAEITPNPSGAEPLWINYAPVISNC